MSKGSWMGLSPGKRWFWNLGRVRVPVTPQVSDRKVSFHVLWLLLQLDDMWPLTPHSRAREDKGESAGRGRLPAPFVLPARIPSCRARPLLSRRLFGGVSESVSSLSSCRS